MAEFLGYRRVDGQVGVRNHLLVLSTGGLTGRTARRVGAMLAGAVVVTLPHSSGLVGRDAAVHRRAISGFATHPNVGAALLVGDNPAVMAQARADIEPSGRPLATFTLDDCGHDALTLTDRAVRAGARLLREISGEHLRVRCAESVTEIEAGEPIPLCHKVSLLPIEVGGPIVKYGQKIGEALGPIAAGRHVRVHNMRSARARAPS